MGDLQGVRGEAQGGAAGVRVPVKHPSHTAGIDKVGGADRCMKRGVGVADENEIVVETGGQFLEPFGGSMVKEEFIGICRAAVEEMESAVNSLILLAEIKAQYFFPREQITAVVFFQGRGRPGVHHSFLIFFRFVKCFSTEQFDYLFVGVAQDGTDLVDLEPFQSLIGEGTVNS